MAEKKNIIWTTGRRKTAVARVRMLPGSGTITVNERTLEDYFPAADVADADHGAVRGD